MLVMIGRYTCLFLLPAMFLAAQTSTASAEDLTEQEQRILKVLDTESIQQLSEAIEGFNNLRHEFERLQEDLESVTDDLDKVVGDANDPVEEIRIRIERLLDQLPDEVQGLIQHAETKQGIAEDIKELRKAADGLQKSKSAFFDLEKQDYQAEVEELLGLDESSQHLAYVDAYRNHLEESLNAIRDPAEYAEQFLAGRFKDWCEKPLPLDDDGSLIFRIIPPESGQALFKPDNGLIIELEYVPQHLVVRATGLCFEYEPGSTLPRADISKLKIDEQNSLVASGTKELLDLGNDFLSELTAGAGVAVKIQRMPDFQAVTSTPESAAIEVDLEFDLAKFAGKAGPVGAEATGVLVYPTGHKKHVDLSRSRINFSYDTKKPIPIPPGVLALWGFDGSIAPTTKSMTLGTAISTTATPPEETIGVYPKLTTVPPFDKFTFSGPVKLRNRFVLMETSGTVDFSRGIVEGKFTSSGDSDASNPLRLLQPLDGEFRFHNKKLMIEGAVELLRQRCARLKTYIDLDSKSADIHGDGGLKLFGQDFGLSLDGRIHDEFAGISFSATQSVGVNVPPLGSFSCAVEVSVSTSAGDEDPVTVKVSALGAGGNFGFSFHVSSLSKCTLAELEKQIRDRVTDGYARAVKAILNEVDNGLDYAAAFDKKFRDEANKRLGFKFETGNPELDAVGATLSARREAVGGALADLNQLMGPGAWDSDAAYLLATDPTESIERASGKLSKWGKNAGGKASDTWKKITGF